MSNKNMVGDEIGKHVKHATLALKYSYQGFLTCFKNEVAFKQEVILGVANLITVLCIPIPLSVRLSMITLWVLLICVELLNSAIEAVVNIASPQYHELAKRAKDYASAAVFCILTLFIGGWVIIAFYFLQMLF